MSLLALSVNMQMLAQWWGLSESRSLPDIKHKAALSNAGDAEVSRPISTKLQSGLITGLILTGNGHFTAIDQCMSVQMLSDHTNSQCESYAGSLKTIWSDHTKCQVSINSPDRAKATNCAACTAAAAAIVTMTNDHQPNMMPYIMWCP